jgi:hypothetical protein
MHHDHPCIFVRQRFFGVVVPGRRDAQRVSVVPAEMTCIVDSSALMAPVLAVGD